MYISDTSPLPLALCLLFLFVVFFFYVVIAQTQLKFHTESQRRENKAHWDQCIPIVNSVVKGL